MCELTDSNRSEIDAIVELYKREYESCKLLHDQLHTSISGYSRLMEHVHSVRSRIKDPEHLRGKLERKYEDAKKNGVEWDISESNLFEKINDLVGLRILHLHTRQIVQINDALGALFGEWSHEIIEGPIAKAWDDESRDIYKNCGITTEPSERLYTSVHYVVRWSGTKRLTCELQVRTLGEELWGEVDHLMNYPKKHESVICREQIKVLARLTSGASRMVDTIILTDEQFKNKK